MKTLIVLLLAAIEVVQAGEIENFYWTQPATNHKGGGEPFSGPKRVPQTHGISELGIERTPCFGSCPVYTCTIRSNGVATYDGVAHVDKIGRWEANIDAFHFHHLANFILETGYSQMDDTFTSSVTDGDTVYTTFVLNGRRKVFRNYASSDPSKLWVFQRLIDDLAAGAKWKRVKEIPAIKEASPKSVQRTGASRSAQETNPTSSAAGSRR